MDKKTESVPKYPRVVFGDVARGLNPIGLTNPNAKMLGGAPPHHQQQL
jgi:hypothetical protein